MIGYHFMQAIIDSGVLPANKVYYGEIPLGVQDAVMVVERGGTYNDDTCVHTALIDVYGRFCSPSELHKVLYDINRSLSALCGRLPELAVACCKDLAYYNGHKYKSRVSTLTSYQDLGKDTADTRLALWSYQITYTEE